MDTSDNIIVCVQSIHFSKYGQAQHTGIKELMKSCIASIMHFKTFWLNLWISFLSKELLKQCHEKNMLSLWNMDHYHFRHYWPFNTSLDWFISWIVQIRFTKYCIIKLHMRLFLLTPSPIGSINNGIFLWTNQHVALIKHLPISYHSECLPKEQWF